MTSILIFLHEFIVAAMALTQATPGLSKDLPKPHYQGNATRFGNLNDKWVGGNLACDSDRRVQPEDHICAHRYMAAKYGCGTVLVLKNPRTNKRSWCSVMDSGPFGAEVYTKGVSGKYDELVYVNGKIAWYVKIRRIDKPPASKCPTGDCIGRWRSNLDMSPATSEDLGHNGMEEIYVWRAERLNKYLDRRRTAKDKREVFLLDKGARDRVAILWSK